MPAIPKPQKEDPSGDESKRVLVAESTWDTDEDFAADIAEQAGSLVEEAVQCNL